MVKAHERTNQNQAFDQMKKDVERGGTPALTRDEHHHR